MNAPQLRMPDSSLKCVNEIEMKMHSASEKWRKRLSKWRTKTLELKTKKKSIRISRVRTWGREKNQCVECNPQKSDYTLVVSIHWSLESKSNIWKTVLCVEVLLVCVCECVWSARLRRWGHKHSSCMRKIRIAKANKNMYAKRQLSIETHRRARTPNREMWKCGVRFEISGSYWDWLWG